VTGWDIAPTAIAAARERAGVRGVPAEFAVRDALHPTAADAGTFDTWVEHTFFTALAPEQRPEYVAAAATLLRPGGLILGLYYCDGVTGGPPFAIPEEELRALVAPDFHVVKLATAANSADRWAGRELAAVLERRGDR
jgi:SAM-dependent methyltransferase